MKKILTILLIILIPAIAISYDGKACGSSITKMNGSTMTKVHGIEFITACSNNASTDYVGDKTVYSAESGTYTANAIFCYLYTSPTMTCDTGTFGYAFVHGRDDGDNIKVCVYTDDGDGSPDSGDSQVGCSVVTFSGVLEAWTQSASKINQAASKSSDYWVCGIAQTPVNITRTASGSRTLYYKTGVDYATPPTNLNGVTSTVESRDASIYVVVE